MDINSVKNSKDITCSIFGHRTIDLTPEFEIKVKKIIETLIVENNVTRFLFGSKSQFYDLCHKIITELQQKYSYVKRIAYTCKSEQAILTKDKEKTETALSCLLNKNIKIKDYDCVVELSKLFYAGKASYVERNKEMVDASDYCLFYYNKDYVSKIKTISGTQIALNYALEKNKAVIYAK